MAVASVIPTSLGQEHLSWRISVFRLPRCWEGHLPNCILHPCSLSTQTRRREYNDVKAAWLFSSTCIACRATKVTGRLEHGMRARRQIPCPSHKVVNYDLPGMCYQVFFPLPGSSLHLAGGLVATSRLARLLIVPRQLEGLFEDFWQQTARLPPLQKYVQKVARTDNGGIMEAIPYWVLGATGNRETKKPSWR
jgi:hypothetical protein